MQMMTFSRFGNQHYFGVYNAGNTVAANKRPSAGQYHVAVLIWTFKNSPWFSREKLYIFREKKQSLASTSAQCFVVTGSTENTAPPSSLKIFWAVVRAGGNSRSQRESSSTWAKLHPFSSPPWQELPPIGDQNNHRSASNWDDATRGKIASAVFSFHTWFVALISSGRCFLHYYITFLQLPPEMMVSDLITVKVILRADRYGSQGAVTRTIMFVGGSQPVGAGPVRSVSSTRKRLVTAKLANPSSFVTFYLRVGLISQSAQNVMKIYIEYKFSKKKKNFFFFMNFLIQNFFQNFMDFWWILYRHGVLKSLTKRSSGSGSSCPLVQTSGLVLHTS